MAEQQQFCLRWNDFHSSFHASLDSLRGDEDFTDVTISCGGQLLRAHRVILSACSSHFKHILKAIPASQHPVIVLPSVDLDVMRAILEFVYQGQVNVRQAQLGAFLQVAESFSIQGLADDETKKNAQRAGTRPRASDAAPAASSTPPAKRRRPEPAPGPPPAPPPPPPLPTDALDMPVVKEEPDVLEELQDMLDSGEDAGRHGLDGADGEEPTTAAETGPSMLPVVPDEITTQQPYFKRRYRSMVWEYFERVTPTDARCLLCARVFHQGITGNTSNLRQHLNSHDIYAAPLQAPGALSARGAASRPFDAAGGARSRSFAAPGGSRSVTRAGVQAARNAAASASLIQIRTEDGTVLDIHQETLDPDDDPMKQ